MDDESAQAGGVTDELDSQITRNESSDDDLVQDVLDEMKDTITKLSAFNPLEDKNSFCPPLPTELTLIPSPDDPQSKSHTEEAYKNAEESDESTGRVEKQTFKTKIVLN
jgi:hypothetical protein